MRIVLLTAAVAIGVAAIAACDKQSAPQVAAKKTSFVVAGNNDRELQEHQSLRGPAEIFRSKVLQVMRDGAWELGGTADAVRLGQVGARLSELEKEGEKFGLIGAPLSSCAFLGSAAYTYWQEMRLPKKSYNAAVLASAKKMYEQGVKDCATQVETPPEPIVTLYGPIEQETPPFPGCMEMIIKPQGANYSEWTSPRGVASQL
ncbi:hypothetical protein [Cupriavidus taiwanensis]|uniref:hypothetical protein n=1 Tax=Cupriavidus taiwanensis TaxID=164546 RepID=UPI00047034DA|nr:hypothetical protein [Cupriavidus taiwanensis]SOZ12065.1 exported protein of unknown function [Cupriavidus taiwanensis]